MTGRRGAKPARHGAVVAVVLALAVAAAPAASQEQPEIVPPPARNVTPPGILPGPQVDGPLYREPTPPPPPEPPRWRRFFLPGTTDSATFRTREGLTIRVYGVSPPAPSDTCRMAEGGEWPCGRTALFSLRKFLRGRAVECYLPPLDSIDRAIAPCRVGRTDIGEWLVRYGWATPDENATEAYRDASRLARCERLGMWRGTEPDAACPAMPPAPEGGPSAS